MEPLPSLPQNQALSSPIKSRKGQNAAHLLHHALHVVFEFLTLTAASLDALEFGHQALLLLHFVATASVEEAQLLLASTLVLRVVAQALAQVRAPNLQSQTQREPANLTGSNCGCVSIE